MATVYDENPQFTWWDLLKSYWYFSEGKRKGLLFWTTLLFLVQFYPLIPPLIMGKVVDFFVSYKVGQSLNPFFTLVVGFGLLNALVAFFRLFSKNKVSQLSIDICYLAKVKGFEKLLDFSLKWHDKEGSGNKAQRIQTGNRSLKEGLGNTMQNNVFPAAASFIGVTLAFLVLKPIFVIFLLFYFAIWLFIQISYYKTMQRINIEKYKALEQASGSYYEGLSNVLTIKTLGAQRTFKKNIIDKEFVSKQFDSKLTFLGIQKWQVFQIFNSVATVLFLLLIGEGVLEKTITVGSILVFYTYMQNLIKNAGDSMSTFNDLVDIKSGISRMMPIYWEEEVEKEGKQRFPAEWNELSISNGSFDYKNIASSNPEDIKDQKIALSNLNFKAEKNQKLGIVGKSGSGKSTFAKLLMGLYSFDQGEYKIGKTNFYDIKHSEITKYMSLVLQDSEMFNLSLKENITLLKNIDNKLFNTAIKIAQLEELIDKLPNGLETMIGEKGYRLSGGERQRVGLARAICKNPQILILDEATSSLDSKTESLVQEGLEKELQSKTMIIIAHRISTLKNVDKIFVFEKGEIVEEGSYDKLLKNSKSKFNEIYRRQK